MCGGAGHLVDMDNRMGQNRSMRMLGKVFNFVGK